MCPLAARALAGTCPQPAAGSAGCGPGVGAPLLLHCTAHSTVTALLRAAGGGCQLALQCSVPPADAAASPSAVSTPAAVSCCAEAAGDVSAGASVCCSPAAAAHGEAVAPAVPPSLCATAGTAPLPLAAAAAASGWPAGAAVQLPPLLLGSAAAASLVHVALLPTVAPLVLASCAAVPLPLLLGSAVAAPPVLVVQAALLPAVAPLLLASSGAVACCFAAAALDAHLRPAALPPIACCHQVADALWRSSTCWDSACGFARDARGGG